MKGAPITVAMLAIACGETQTETIDNLNAVFGPFHYNRVDKRIEPILAQTYIAIHRPDLIAAAGLK